MEAEGYLSSGYGTRLSIEQKQSGWKYLGKISNIWQPNRLKGIQVSDAYGAPFLSATQVFDVRPVSRKWLAVERTPNYKQRFLSSGQIVVTCSGAVGRATLAHAPHDGVLISHDLLRVNPESAEQWGWIYAYLRTPQAKAMMISAQYGHIIKHLEVAHLEAIPIPSVAKETEKEFKRKVSKILKLRNGAYWSALAAEKMLEEALGGLPSVTDWGEDGFSVKASTAFFNAQKRIDAVRHNPGATKIWKYLEESGREFTTLKEANYEVWVPKRYKRIPAENGVAYYDSADLLTLTPESVKTYADGDFGDHHRGRVKADWLLMPCSGQVYGIIGSVVIAGKGLEGKIFSNHVLRIAPTETSSIAKGYLLTVLSHPVYGRPLIKALAHGSSVPEIDPMDIEQYRVVRVSEKEEADIAVLAEQAVRERSEADVLEREIAAEASEIVEEFVG